MANYRSIHTNYGRARIAQAEATGIAINLVQMAVGDGNGHEVEPNPAQTFLARERYRATLNSLIVDANDPTKVIAEFVVPASEGGFTIREVGLFDDQGNLFVVGNTPPTYKPVATEGAFADTVIRLVVLVSNASVVNLIVDPNVAIATQSWVRNNVTAAGIIPGGLTNQVLAKASNADGDTEWRDASEAVVVDVSSREETQTLAAGQTVIDLAVLTTEGAAVYIEGTRLRNDEFSVTSDTRITLASAHPVGAKATVVQNEEVGESGALRRLNNLSDVQDKPAAIANLGMATWLAGQPIQWLKLEGIPAFASRWPTFAEVTDKPAAYPAASHTHPWNQVTGAPETATRWPAWGEVTGKPSTFTPASHAHPEYLPISGGQITGFVQFGTGVPQLCMRIGNDVDVYDVDIPNTVRLNGISNSDRAGLQFGVAGAVLSAISGGTNPMTWGGSFTANGGYDFGSSRKLKNVDGPLPYGLAELLQLSTLIGRYKPEYNDDGRVRLFFDAENMLEVMPECVDAEGVEFNGERVPAIKIDQVLPVIVRAIQELAAR